MVSLCKLKICLVQCFASVYSSELGPEDCGTTVNLTSVNNTIIYVPNGTSCFQCEPDIFFVKEYVFRFNDTVINSTNTLARVVKNDTQGIDSLVVFDSESAFSTFSVTYVQCCENNHIITMAQDKLFCKLNNIMAKVGVLFYYGEVIQIFSCMKP